MQLLDLTLDRPSANVALDEALLEACEAGEIRGELLRLWEPEEPIVVVGRSSHVAQEVDVAYCRGHGISILRRASGGAAIVTGPGCLMYALVLQISRWPELAFLDTTHRLVLRKIAEALKTLGADARIEGTSDLAIGNRKISGNSMRRKRDWVLYHGTLLYGLSSSLIERCLRTAPRQPEYRRGRSHAEFVSRIPAGAEELKRVLIEAWDARAILPDWPRELTDRFERERYLLDPWNFAR